MVKYKLVDNEPKYWMFIRDLRTHPQNISGFIQQEEISNGSQISYMEREGHRFFVCLVGDHPVGFISFNEGSDVTIAVDPEYKRQGVGSFMVKQLEAIKGPLKPKVKKANTSSIFLFTKLGYTIKEIRTGYYVFEKYQTQSI